MKEKKKRGTCGTLLIILLVLFVIIAIIPSNPKEEQSPVIAEMDPKEEQSPVIAETDPKVELQNQLRNDYGFGEISTVNNDVTGNWRLVHYSTDATADKFILDYYKAFFQSEDEIHILINDKLNTTITMRSVLDNYLLTYEVHEHVEGEEEDAKKLGNGEILGQYQVYVESGEIEELHPEEDELTEEQLELLENSGS